jgi:PAS domain S-box-containing protein
MPEKPTYEELEEKFLEFERDELARKQAKEDLQLTQFSVDNSTDAVYWMGPDAKFIYVNHAAVAALGYSKEELLTMTVHDIGPEFPTDIWPAHWTELKEKKSFAIQTIHQRKDGSTFPVEITVNFIQFGSKEINCAIAKDITERKQAVEVLRERTRELNERVKELNCLYGISNLVEKPGISLDEVIQGSVDLIPPSWHYSEITCSRIILENKEYKTENFKETDWKQSKEIFVHENLAGIVEVCYLEEKVALDEGPFLKEERALINAIAERLGRILERKHTEAALKKTQRLLTEAQRIGRVGGWEFNIDTGKQTWSEEVYNIHEVDLTYDPTVGEGVNFYTSASRPIIEQAVQRVVNHSEPFDVELEIITAKGNLRNVHAIGKADLENHRVYGFFQDITETRHLQAQLLESQKMEAIGTLTGGIAHDYNNLMSIVMGNLSMAQEEAEPGSDLADFLNEANMASHKVRNLTHELMSLSKGGRPVREVGSLNEVVKNVSELIPVDSGISLMESISQDLKLVPYDRLKMRAVIKNVVKNAVEAMPDGGTLKIKAENLRVEDAKQDSCLILKPGDFVHISIQDQGKGIPKEHLDKIFDPYFSTKAMGTQKGMGLGLATSYAIVQKHGGHITINSSSGAGTTVNIYLPAESQPEEIHKSTTSTDNKTSPLKRVLFMDDEKDLRTLFQKMLESLGYKVVTVKDGVEAIETYKKNMVSEEPFDAVILDLTIKGGMGGEQTIRELLKIDPDVKAIVSSGYFDDPVMSDFKKYGFMGALPKPYEKKALKEVLERLSE